MSPWTAFRECLTLALMFWVLWTVAILAHGFGL